MSLEQMDKRIEKSLRNYDICFWGVMISSVIVGLILGRVV